MNPQIFQPIPKDSYSTAEKSFARPLDELFAEEIAEDETSEQRLASLLG